MHAIGVNLRLSLARWASVCLGCTSCSTGTLQPFLLGCQAAKGLLCMRICPLSLTLTSPCTHFRPVLARNVVPGFEERSERTEQCSKHSWACSGHVAKISMLRLNIGSGMLSLSSCILNIGRGPRCEQSNGEAVPLALNGFGSRTVLGRCWPCMS